MKINLDPKALAKVDRAITQSFKKAVDAYAEENRAAIESPIWEWDGITVRSTGDVVSSPRDIVDTGELRDSQSVSYPTPNTAEVDWAAAHAIGVHEGFDSQGNPIPARPWTEEAKDNTDFEGIMKAELKRQLS